MEEELVQVEVEVEVEVDMMDLIVGLTEEVSQSPSILPLRSTSRGSHYAQR